jgi:hypothetical protein
MVGDALAAIFELGDIPIGRFFAPGARGIKTNVV